MQSWLPGLLLAAAGCGPGLLLAEWLLFGQPRTERFIAGLVTSAALIIALSYVATILARPELTFALLGVVALAVVLARRRWPTTPNPDPGIDRTGLIVGALAILAAWGWYAVPMLLREIPDGYDPSFHLPIVELIRSRGALPDDWGNYEPGERFDYPAALHSAMALAGAMTSTTTDQVYNATMLALGLLLLLEMWVVGTRIGGSPMVGVLSVLILGFTDGWGTLTSHGQWGGLANLAGLVLLFGVILGSVQPTRMSLVIASICACALALEHHLTFAILMFVVAFVGGLEWLSERALSPPSRAAIIATIIAFGTAGVSVLLRPTGRFKIGDALTYGNEYVITLSKMVEDMGVPMLLIGGAGLVAAVLRARGPIQRLAAAWAIALIGFWAFFDIVYRTVANVVFHANVSAFTPTRGITDAAVFASIAGGAFLWSLVSERPWRNAGVAAIGLLLAALNASAEWRRITQAIAQAPEARELRELCTVIKETTPEESVVFMGETNFPQWPPYLSDREFNRFWEPAYHMTAYRLEKRRIRDPITFAKFERDIVVRPVYFATPGGEWEIDPAAIRLAWAGPHWKLYEVLQ